MDFICLLRGHISAGAQGTQSPLGTPIKHPKTMWNQLPVDWPQAILLEQPQLGFHGFSNPLLPSGPSLPMHCSGQSREERLPQQLGTPELCPASKSLPTAASGAGWGMCSANVVKQWPPLTAVEGDESCWLPSVQAGSGDRTAVQREKQHEGLC